MKSASLARLSRKPMEFLSEVALSEVVEVVFAVSGLEDAEVPVSREFFLYTDGDCVRKARGIDHALVGRLFTQALPNSLHFLHGTLLSHFTFSLEHSSHACRFRPRSRELGIAEFPRRSHRLKWSRRTSLGEETCQCSFFRRDPAKIPPFERFGAEFTPIWPIPRI
jgi:hypothetical protein